MPRLRSTAPKVRYHSAHNAAVADYYDSTGRRRMVKLGPWDSAEARQALARLTAELAAGKPAGGSDLTVAELLVSFLKHAIVYYRRPDGTPTSEIHGYRSTCRALKELYGETIAAEFGIPHLKAVRHRMIEKGLARNTINQMTWRVKKIMKWAAGEGHVPPSVFQSLQVVPGLQAGRSAARETEPVGPVALEVVAATLPHVTRPVSGMIRLQQATGMRPGEVVCIRPCDIDRSGPTWKYTPTMNKMAHKGKRRVVFLGPIAQAVLAEFTPTDPAGFFFASPRKPGTSYTVSGYGLAVRRSCRGAGIDPWHPHQLRHSHATRVRHEYGLDGAQVTLGHAKAAITEVYAAKDEALAARIAAEIG